jgi:DNA-binding transcriptional LysR family regulator
VDTAEIDVFLVLAEELHFGRTAERLRMPQPRVSRLVSAQQGRVRRRRARSCTRLGPRSPPAAPP